MAERGEGMHVEYGNEPENVVNNNTRRQSGVTITYNFMLNIVPIPSLFYNEQYSISQRTTSNIKVTQTKLLDIKKVSNTQSKPKDAKDRVTQYSEDTFPNVLEPVGKRQKKQHQTEKRLDYEKWSVVMETGFGGILIVRTRLILKRLARWLLEKYDPWDTSLNLPNGKVLLDEEDVYVTIDLPNVERGGPPIGSMHEVILQCGGHGHEFITDFIAYAISTCIVGNANDTCHFRVLKYLCNNWCAYVIKCLNDAIREWKGDKNKFFMGPLLLLIVSTFDQPISLMCTQLFYLDIVQFRANKVERWLLVAINWPTEKVRKRDKDEQLHGEYGRGRIIERIEYHNVARLAEVDLKVYLQECKRTNPKREDLLSMTTATRGQRCPYCPRCNGQLQDAIPITNDPIDIACGNQNVTDCLSPNDTYYCIPEFLEYVDQLESTAREKMQQKRMGFSPPSFSLGISPKKEPCASH
ncbi:LOW QUALITY PROTEIN: hypothetical protein Cgig2_002679 [Carnegiea gigantea]|uniref:Uncharacterized protein n=1 Tax=Carnegiea gigantea TaxID=171969 RepID=A0A9Q1K3H5_9CARY|nr:LOW QUALITY PROTEIN: hypothetical protein Cgig2_002679 [Carnegiea gigantea]